MDTINGIMGALMDLLLWPFRGMAAEWGLVAISLLSGVLLLLVYGRVSNQNGIRNAKRKIMGYLLESILYRHDIGLSLKAQRNMLGQACVYFGHALPPIMILMIPCLLILAQLNLRYNSRGLPEGEPTLVTVQLDKPNYLDAISVREVKGAEITPRLRIPESSEVVWRVTPVQSEPIELVVKVGEGAEQYAHQIVPQTSSETARPLPSRQYKAWWWSLLYPGQPILPKDSPISRIVFDYPETSYSILGIEMHWLVAFLVFSILSGIVASRIFKVQI